MMFYGAKIKDNCFYFIKTLSENKTLVKFIDEMNDNSSSYSMMPQWENKNGIYKKRIYKNNTSDNVRIYQKCLYIINSIDSGIRYCLGLFCENSSFSSFDLQSIDLYKIDSPSQKDLNSFVDKDDANLYSAYMFINNDPEKIKITFNQNGQAFVIDQASIFVVSNKEDVSIEYNASEPLYFAKATVDFLEDQNSGMI